MFFILLSPNFLNGCVGSKATQLDSEQNSYLMSLKQKCLRDCNAMNGWMDEDGFEKDLNGNELYE